MSWNSNDEFFGPSRVGVQSQVYVERRELGLGQGGFSHVQGTAGTRGETAGDAALNAQDLAQAMPTFVDVLVGQARANDLDELIGEYRDEQMGVAARPALHFDA